MSHELDMSNGRANMAYIGATPWHGLGQRLHEGASTEQVQEAAGLNWRAELTPVRYVVGAELKSANDRYCLYRDDTGAALGVVSGRYVPTQPHQIMDFFRTLVDDIGGYSLETAGSLFGGKRIWALARVGEAAEVTDGDKVAPYIMLATSFDGSLATLAQFTTVRVVCNNTLQLSLGGIFRGAVTVRHTSVFEAAQVRAALGIAGKSFATLIEDMRDLANTPLNVVDAQDFLVDLIEPEDADKFTASPAFARLLKGFTHQNIGHDGDRSRWQMLNTITEHVDWSAGYKQDSRLSSAWFGKGAALKTRALDLLLHA